MAHSVFISYASRDAALAQAVVERFEAADVPCWIAPRDIQAGKDWSATIPPAIDEAKVVVLLLSASSAASDQVAREVHLAQGSHKIVVPFRVDACEASGALRYLLSGLHRIDAPGGSPESKFDELLRHVSQALSESQAFESRGKAAPVRPNNLPREFSSFVGREAQVDAVIALVESNRLVTLIGAGGIGKTRTSLQVGAKLLDGPADGVWFVELAPLSAGEYIPSTIALALRLSLPPEGDPVENIVRALGERQLLLVFDNCEHLLEPSARVISAILRGCPHVKVLASSRQPIGVSGEASYRLPSLNDRESVALFVARAKAANDAFALVDEDTLVLADICRRLDGIPLAIELAASRVKMLKPRQLLERLDERFRVLTGGSRDALPRQQTLRATIDWSYELLDERERELFRRLGIFVNGFTIDGAVAIAGNERDELDTFDVLGSLVDKSLVMVESRGNAMRYWLLESTRAYAVEKLDGGGDRDAIAAFHLRYLREEFGALRERNARTARLAELADVLQEELEDVRAALDGALARSEVVDGGELLGYIGSTWQPVGLLPEGIARCEAYLAALPVEESYLRARLSTALSRMLVNFGHVARALEVSTQAVAQARASGDALELALALCQYANAATINQRPDDAERALVEADAIPGKTAFLRISLLEATARLSHFRGDLETAARMYTQICKEDRALGNIRAEQITALNLAEVEHARGQTQLAIEILREMLPAVRADTDKNTRSNILVNLVGYLVAVDDLSGARDAGRELLTVAGHEPDDIKHAVVLEHLALVFALRGDRERAAMLEGYSDAAIRRVGLDRGFTEVTTHDRLTGLLREHLGQELAGLLDAGATLTPDGAIALALEQAPS